MLALLLYVIAMLFKRHERFILNKFLRSDIMNDKNFKKSKGNVPLSYSFNVCIHISNKRIRINMQVSFLSYSHGLCVRVITFAMQ